MVICPRSVAGNPLRLRVVFQSLSLMNPEALRHLAAVDPAMDRLIRAVGPCTIRAQRRSPFEALVRAVAHQQLNGKAADTITRRFLDLFPGRRFPTPVEVERMDESRIRAAGFSGSKVRAIRDIAAKAREGIVPERRVLARLDDEAIVERLIQCRGVGRWTVEMFLMFTLARPDVLPVDDFGVRSGFQLTYRLPGMPLPRELLEFGDRWRPYRTTASWYLWRAVDLAREARFPG
jgi:DNA-3-methyladenine glycosylase II